MIEYCTKTNKIKQIVKYPQNIKPGYHSLCKHNNNIYIFTFFIDGDNGEIILFNPSTKQFKQILKTPKTYGFQACCLALHDDIYIFDVARNCSYFRYSIKENKINTFNHFNDKINITKSKMTDVSILKYKDTIIRFGGYDLETRECVDRFVISTQIRNECKWTEILNYKLPKPMSEFGYILYRNYILIFGGKTTRFNVLDTIYLLDLNNRNNKWIKLNHIKCPLKSRYYAALDSNNNNIHLFTQNDDYKRHYAVGILDVFGDLYVRNNNILKQCTYIETITFKCSRCKMVFYCNAKCQSVHWEKHKRKCKTFKTNKQEMENKNNENKVTKQLQLLKKDKSDLERKYNAINKLLSKKEIENNDLRQSNKRMQQRYNSLDEQYKKLEIKYNNLETKYVQQQKKYGFESWITKDVVNWIVNIDKLRYNKYEKMLLKNMRQEGIDGLCLPDLDKNDLLRYGITQFKDRIHIYNNIQKLVQKNEIYDNDQNEGQSATYL